MGKEKKYTKNSSTQDKERFMTFKRPRLRNIAGEGVLVIVVIVIALILIQQLSVVTSSPVRENVTLSFIQNGNEAVNFTGDSLSVALGNPVSNTLTYSNEIVANSTNLSSPMLLTQLTAINTNGFGLIAETYSNASNFYSQKPDSLYSGSVIYIVRASSSLLYLDSFVGQYSHGSLNMTNGLSGTPIDGGFVYNKNYQSQSTNTMQINTNVVSPYYLDVNQSAPEISSLGGQDMSVDLSSSTHIQAILNLVFSSSAFGGIFIINNPDLEGNYTYDRYISITGFNSLSLGVVSTGTNVKVPYNYVERLTVSSSSSKYSTFQASYNRFNITDNQGFTTSLNGSINLTTPESITMVESGYYPSESFNLLLSYLIQSNYAMINRNGSSIYFSTGFKQNIETRNWMSLSAGALIGGAVTESISLVRRII